MLGRFSPSNRRPAWIRHGVRPCTLLQDKASSITIDAAIFDTPIVNLRFDAEPGRPYLKSVRRQYDTDHYLQVLRSGAVRLADSPEELIDEVRRYLADSAHERTERRGLVRALAFKDDGQAGARVAQAIARIGARPSLQTWATLESP